MAELFREARQSRIFQDVVEQIEEAIISGRLRVGDRLPPERDLKETLKTSRSTLREALRVLEHKGLIEIRLGKGGGAMVKSISAEQISQSLGLLIRSQQVTLPQLAEFRERFEGDIAALAAAKAASADTARLDELVAEARRCVDGGKTRLNDFLEADKQIHLHLARITANPIYISILQTVHDNIRQYFQRYLIMNLREMRENLSDLTAIVEAVKAGRADDVRELARAHVRRFNAYMQAHQEAPGQSAPEPNENA